MNGVEWVEGGKLLLMKVPHGQLNKHDAIN